MKKYFFIIRVKVNYRSTGETRTDSQKAFYKGVMEVEEKEDKASLIYDKALKKVMAGWELVPNVRTKLKFFNFWEEKETIKDSNLKTVIGIEKILNNPITVLDVNLATWEQLEKIGFKTLRDIVSMTEKGLQLLELSEMAICNIKEALSVYKLKLAK